MKRIIFTVTNDLTYDQRMFRICKSLQDNNYNVTLIGRKLINSIPLNNTFFKQIRINCIFIKGPFFYIEYNTRLFFFLLFQRFDLLSAVDLDTIFPCYLVSKLRFKKCVFDSHELFTEMPELENRHFVKKIWEIIGKITVHRMDSCYTTTNSIGIILSKKYNKNFRIIRNMPVYSELPLSENENKEKFIIYQGAINKGRALEVLIHSIQSLDIKLVIVGDGDISKDIKNLVNNLNLQNKVSFLGKLTPDELILLTPKAFLGYNLLDDTHLTYYYSLCNKFFDYIHAGIPSLTNDFPEYSNINDIYNVACLINPEEQIIVNKVTFLLKNTEYYNQLKANCLKAKKDLCWQNEETNILAIYNAL